MAGGRTRGGARRAAGNKAGTAGAPAIKAKTRWTQIDRESFLAELSVTPNVTQAARGRGLCEKQAYKLRDREADFRRGWEAALASGYARLELMLLERALGLVPPDEKGTSGGGSDKTTAAGLAAKPASAPAMSDRVAMQLLSQHRATVERVRQAEAETAPPDGGTATVRLLAKLELMGRRLSGEG